MKNWLTLLMILMTISLSAEHMTSPYEFIWAPSGMNLREAPGTDKTVITKLAFGDSLTILSTTDITYNVMGLSNVDSTQHYHTRYIRKAPYILYGKWVEVLTSAGEIGYVIDQYLLPFRPEKREDMYLEFLSQDTVVVQEENYSPRFLVKKYENNISSCILINEKYYSESFTFPNMTIQEVFVVLSSTRSSLEYVKVGQNWKDSLSFGDGMCSFSIQQKDGFVELLCECSC